MFITRRSLFCATRSSHNAPASAYAFLSQHQFRYRSFLIGYDGSIHSKYALKQVLRHYSQPSDTIILANYFEGIADATAGVSRSPWTEIPHLPSDVEIVQRMQKEVAALMDRVGKKYTDRSFEMIVDYHPSAKYALVEQAEKREVDTLVVGSYGLNVFARILALRHIGSVAEYAVRNAHCNVLVIKDQEALKDEKDEDPKDVDY